MSDNRAVSVITLPAERNSLTSLNRAVFMLSWCFAAKTSKCDLTASESVVKVFYATVKWNLTAMQWIKSTLWILHKSDDATASLSHSHIQMYFIISSLNAINQQSPSEIKYIV